MNVHVATRSAIRTLLVLFLFSSAWAVPVITSISPDTGPTVGGDPLNIDGSGFGINPFAVTVTIGGATAPVNSVVDNQIICTSPPGQGANLPVVVNVSGVDSNTKTYSYQPPVIVFVDGSAETAGGTPITIYGINFGTSGTLTIAGNPVPTTLWTDNLITFNAPAGEGFNALLVVTVSCQSGTSGLYYLPPFLASLSPPSATPLSVTTLTIEGSNFGLNPIVLVNSNPTNILTKDHSTITLDMPVGLVGEVMVTVVVGGQAANPLPFQSTFPPPELISLTPDEGPHAEATEITIEGTNYGFNPLVLFNSVPATITASSSTSLTCLKPFDQGGPIIVTVIAEGQLSINSLTYNSIKLTSLPGYYINEGTGEVLPAPPGTYTDLPDMIAPITAPAGAYTPVAGMQGAIPASPGYFVPVPGSSSQTPAAQGRIVPGPGAVADQATNPGYYAPLEGMRGAIAASPGYYVASGGQINQEPAPAGSFVPNSGSVSATPASPGYYAPIQGLRSGIPAPVGTYVMSAGATSPTPIPPGFTSSGEGASEIIALPNIAITAYTLESNGDNTITFDTDPTQTYAIFYSENLVDFLQIDTVPGTGSEVSRTFTPPASPTGRRFYIVGPAPPSQ